MGGLDFDQARVYALEQLRNGLSPALTYHSLAHTQDEVVPATRRLARGLGVAGEPLKLLLTAAWYHDLGLIKDRVEHEAIGMAIARQALPQFGYTSRQIEQICAMIMATRLPQNPRTLLEEIIADADLDVLGREDFIARNAALRSEMAFFGFSVSDIEWYRSQMYFFQRHHYFTSAARILRNRQKQRNIAVLRELLNGCET